MDDARAVLIGRLLRILILAVALWLAIGALDFRGPDPEVPRYVLDAPPEHEFGPKGPSRSAETGPSWGDRTRSRLAK